VTVDGVTERECRNCGKPMPYKPRVFVCSEECRAERKRKQVRQYQRNRRIREAIG